MRKKNDLSAASSEMVDDCCTNTGSSSLQTVSLEYRGEIVKNTVTMIILECIKRSEVLLAPPKYHFRSHVSRTQGNAFSTGRAKGIESTPSKIASANKGIGISTARRGQRSWTTACHGLFEFISGNNTVFLRALLGQPLLLFSTVLHHPKI